MEHIFFPEFKWTPTLRCTPESNYWRDADVDHTQTIGGIQSNYWGRYIPRSPPGFGTPIGDEVWRFNASITPKLESENSTIK